MTKHSRETRSCFPNGKAETLTVATLAVVKGARRFLRRSRAPALRVTDANHNPHSCRLGCGLNNACGLQRRHLAIAELTSNRVKHLRVPLVSYGTPPTLVSYASLATFEL